MSILRSPLFRWGMPATSAAIAVAIVVLLVEDQVVRLTAIAVCALNVLVVPQILKRAAREG